MADIETTAEDIIQDYMSYDPETGSLKWLERPAHLFSGSEKRSSNHVAANWNSRNAGKEAFTAVGVHGYRTGTLMGRRLLLHRVAFFIQKGVWPSFVDHINGDRLDNRWVNLRQVSHAQNNRNSKGYGGTSAFIGVSWNKSLEGYMAKVHHNGRTHYCGFSKTDPEKVARKRDAKALELFGEHARLNFPVEKTNG